MKKSETQLSVPLSHLVPSRRNPRKVKPSIEAHRRLVALIRSQGLLQPLVVRPSEAKAGQYEIVAGERRLRALREIYRNDGDPRIACIVRDVDTSTADAFSLGENFGREPMHPLDEAEAFAKLATTEGKDAQAIAAEFGVGDRYVRQRIKLAALADVVKTAYREGEIDTGTAEAFAAVPEDRQLEVWKELGGHPRHAEHVRNVIAHAWIDGANAKFDVVTLPESAVSRDLFGDRVLIERKAFMEAQSQALSAQQQSMADQGWSKVIIGRREDVQDQLYAMEKPEREFDQATTKKLDKIAARQQKLEEAAEKIDDHDQTRLDRLQQRHESLAAEEQEILEQAPEYVSEETKATATAFLILDPDGRIHQEYRVPRQRRASSVRTQTGTENASESSKPAAPTSDQLSDTQLAVTFTHQALAVRETLLKNAAARKRVLVMILHEKVRCEALAIRPDANAVTIKAGAEGFSSSAWNRLKALRAKLDPLADQFVVEDRVAYEHLAKLSPAKLDGLIDLLIVDCITAHMARPTILVPLLAQELKVNVRADWHPDAQWLAGYQKIQLAHLVTELKGAVHAPSADRKKSELVEMLAKLFADAADGKLEDKQLAERVNGWLPCNLRPEPKSQEEPPA